MQWQVGVPTGEELWGSAGEQTHAVSEGWKHGRRPPHTPGDEGCSHTLSLLG